MATVINQMKKNANKPSANVTTRTNRIAKNKLYDPEKLIEFENQQGKQGETAKKKLIKKGNTGSSR